MKQPGCGGGSARTRPASASLAGERTLSGTSLLLVFIWHLTRNRTVGHAEEQWKQRALAKQEEAGAWFASHHAEQMACLGAYVRAVTMLDTQGGG